MYSDLPPIIDAHCHIFPQKIAEKATVSIGQFYQLAMHEVGSAEHLLAEIEPFPVKTCLVCSTATKPEQTRPINDFLSRTQSDHSDKFYAFGTVHQDLPLEDAFAELDHLVASGLHGIKLHPDFQRFPIDLDQMLPIYQRMAELKLPVLFHMGDCRYDYSSPKRLARLVRKVPDLLCIAAHLGGYTQWEEAECLAGLDNVFFDCSSTLGLVSPEFARKQMSMLGYDRIFFGSDFPMWRIDDEIDRFLALKLGDTIEEAIFHENFERLILQR